MSIFTGTEPTLRVVYLCTVRSPVESRGGGGGGRDKDLVAPGVPRDPHCMTSNATASNNLLVTFCSSNLKIVFFHPLKSPSLNSVFSLVRILAVRRFVVAFTWPPGPYALVLLCTGCGRAPSIRSDETAADPRCGLPA